MKLLSIQSMLKGIKNSFARFAPAIIVAIIGTAAAYALTYNNEYKNEHLYRFVFCAALGLPFFIAIRLYCEKSGIRYFVQLILYFAALALLAGYFFTLPEKVGSTPSIRFVLLITGMHLLVSFSAFTAKGESNGFWQFNKALFLRILTALLFSGVLYLGLSLAILAVDKLFSVYIDGLVYARLWIVIAGIFNTWFFLAGVPDNLKNLENITEFPKGLKIFTQYVLFPLVFIYMLILYVYAFKIVFTWNFPDGWVSYLVLYFSTAGIFSLLLIHPVKNIEGNNRIRFAGKWFYIALVPMLVLLAIAIWKRTGQYGITENRYFIVVLNAWLAFISFYFIISKTKNIKIIPVSLCILAFITSFGPWSAFSISKNSQFRQLEKTLGEAKMLVNGKIILATEDLSVVHGNRIVSIVDYLDNADALDKIKPWFKQDIDSLFKSDTNRWVDKSEKILALMGIDKWNFKYYRAEGSEESMRFNYYSNYKSSYSVKGFDYSLNYNVYNSYNGNDTADDFKNITGYSLDYSDSLTLHFNRKNNIICFIKEKDTLIDIDVTPVLEKVRGYIKAHPGEVSHNNFPADVMMSANENNIAKVCVYFSQIGGNKNKNKVSNIENINSFVLIKFKEEKF